jgi:Acetyltransferase (GNAT) domain
MRPGEPREGDLRIEEIRPASAEEWDAIWAACDYATYFHSREWAEIWQGCSGGRIRPRPRLLTFSDGTSALVPLSVEGGRRPRARSRQLSSPAGTYGGWLSADRLDKRHAGLLAHHLLGLADLVWRVNPFDEVGAQTASGAGGADHTRVLRLDVGFGALLSGWTKGHRSAARKALREGVSISLATSLGEWRRYFEVYRGALERWGDRASSSYGWEIFEGIRARSSPHVRLWLARHADEILAGALVLSAKEHVVYWHGASLPDADRLRPVHLLLHEVLRVACDEGYAVFDFNPSGGHAGVDAFKKGFGATALAAPVVRTSRRSLRAQLGALLRSRWRS